MVKPKRTAKLRANLADAESNFNGRSKVEIRKSQRITTRKCKLDTETNQEPDTIVTGKKQVTPKKSKLKGKQVAK